MTDNVFILALKGEGWLDIGRDNVVNYTFASDFGAPWQAAEKAAFASVFAAYESVADISFVQTSRASAEIVENKVTSAQMLAQMGFPWNGWHDEPGQGQRRGLFDFTQDYWSGSLDVGGKAYWLILHEIGHAIGLEHPHSTWHGSGLFPGVSPDVGTDEGDFGLNSVLTTAMSYRLMSPPSFAYGQVAGPMAFDIATLQDLYGAKPNETGDNTYMLPRTNGTGTYWTCIWDTGGIDTLAHMGPLAAVLDLRPATLRNEPGGGGFFSSADGIQGGFSIANGVIIENAIGGSGDDLIQGNAVANSLSGGAGNDRIWGDEGNDLINGGAGFDTLDGGAGNDTYIVIDSGARETIIDSSGIDTVISLVDYYLAGLPIETLRLAGSALLGWGNGLNNTISGTGANNELFGEGGADTIDGAAGDDWLVGGLGKDTITGGLGSDTFFYESAAHAGLNYARDVLKDFTHLVDKIDLSRIDANGAAAGSTAFRLVAGNAGAFTNAQGQLRWYQVDRPGVANDMTIIEGDINGDARPDFQIQLLGLKVLTAGDFVL